MTRATTLAASLAALFLTLWSPVAAASDWGEIGFQLTSGSDIVRLIGWYDNTGAAVPLDDFRYGYKEGASAWDYSHQEGDGVSVTTYQDLRVASLDSQTHFDTDASTALGNWYDSKGSGTQSMLRDVTRRTTVVLFGVRTEDAGNSGLVGMDDYAEMETAAENDDRQAFDTAAENAWGSWYTNLSADDADLVWQIQIDATSAG